MARLRIYLFGSPRLTLDGASLDIRRRKGIALLAYLGATARPQNREGLVGLLWPEAGPSRAQANLRHLLWFLRQHGLGEQLKAGHDSIRLDFDSGVWVDVVEFRRRARSVLRTGGTPVSTEGQRERLVHAVELYQGPFLSGFGLRENLAFDEWQLQQAENTRAELSSVFDHLIQDLVSSGEISEAVGFARRWLSHDPYNETVLRRLMLLYEQDGRRAEALEAFNNSSLLFHRELGLELDPETVALRDRLKSNSPPRRGSPETPRPRLPAADAAPGRAMTVKAAGDGGQGTRAAGPDSPSRADAPLRPPVSTMPDPPSPLLGRGEEMEELRRLLAEPDCRLLSVTGPGGEGKTRLAIEIARTLGHAFHHGIRFVSLAAVESPEFLFPAVIETLGLTLIHPEEEDSREERPDPSLLRMRLLEFLRNKRMLLILDNLEHLSSDLSAVRDILKECGSLKILATSRVPLRLEEEAVFRLGGLDVPGEADAVSTYRSFGAVQLFLHRARRARARYRPGVEDLRTIAAICRSLDGNPLAIELAAAWMGLLSCRDIARELEADSDFLIGRSEITTPRHSSLRTVFATSWNLLGAGERSALRRLAVFPGRFSREAAEEVAGTDLATLSSLADKSMIRAYGSGFEIHSVIRQYAREELSRSTEEVELAQTAQAAHYLRRLAEAGPRIQGNALKQALSELSRELENTRVAWLWAVERGRTDLLLPALQPLFLYYDIRSRFQEGAELFHLSLQRIDGPPPNPDQEAAGILRALCSACLAWFIRHVAPRSSRDLIRKSLGLLEARKAEAELSFVRILAGILGAYDSGGELKSALDQALRHYRESGDPWWEAMGLEVYSFIHLPQDPATALVHAQRSLQLRRQIGDVWGVPLSLYNLGSIADSQGQIHVARQRYLESLRLREKLGEDLEGVASCLIHLGRLARAAGRWGEAQRHLDRAARRLSESGSAVRAAWARTVLGMILYDQGRTARARRLLEEVLKEAEGFDDPARTSVLLSFLAFLTLGSSEEEAIHFHQRAAATFHSLRPEQIERLPSGSSLDFPVSNPWMEMVPAVLAFRRGDLQAAAASLARALDPARDAGLVGVQLEILLFRAEIQVRLGHPDDAARILGAIQEQPALPPRLKGPAGEMLQQVEKSLGRRKTAALLEEGRELSLEQAFEEISPPGPAPGPG